MAASKVKWEALSPAPLTCPSSPAPISNIHETPTPGGPLPETLSPAQALRTIILSRYERFMALEPAFSTQGAPCPFSYYGPSPWRQSEGPTRSCSTWRATFEASLPTAGADGRNARAHSNPVLPMTSWEANPRSSWLYKFPPEEYEFEERDKSLKEIRKVRWTKD